MADLWFTSAQLRDSAGAKMPTQASSSKPFNPASVVVGTWGSPGWRVLPATARPLSLPACTCPITDGGVVMNTCTWPDSTSCTAGPEPRYGMCTMLVLVCILNISVPMCDSDPLPWLA